MHGGHGWGNGDYGFDGNEEHKHVILRFDIQEPSRSRLHCLLGHSEDLPLLAPISSKKLY